MKRSFSDSGHSAKRSVLIALSGGIDSTAAALMLLDQGYDLIGCTFTTRYTQPSSIEAAQRVAAQLGIEHHVFDYTERFEQTIVDYFVSEYQAARTPNPCVLCNREIKFGALLAEADRLGCALIATGHYAKIGSRGVEEERSRGVGIAPKKLIGIAADAAKDQSYFLWQIDPGVLDRVLFPLGDYTKQQVRAYLASKGFEALSKQGESQDICFIKGDYRAFLRERVGDNYKEYMSFTIGQRKGLGVALGYPAFVTRIGSRGVEEERSRGVECRGVGVEHPLVQGVYLGHYEDLYTDTVTLRDILFYGDPNQPVMAKIRYRSPAVEAILQQSGRLSFTQPVWAPTPGQSCVFYQNNFVVGGGIIGTLCKDY